MSKNMNIKAGLRATILKKLKRRGKWGGAHTSFDVLARGIPKHLRGEAKEVATELIKDGLLLSAFKANIIRLGSISQSKEEGRDREDDQRNLELIEISEKSKRC